MIRPVLLLLLALLNVSPALAENYAARSDVQAFATDLAQRHAFDSAALLRLFAQTQPVAAAIKFMLPPKDPAVRSWKTYRARFVEPRRIAAGQKFMQRHSEALSSAENRFGVPREIISSIIGVETIYGKHLGRFKTFSTLTTLAFDYPPRAVLFRQELEELLLLAREEKRDPLSYSGSFAGALGLPQFLPSSIRRYALDFDGNGKIDLDDSPVDAIGSVANFLAAHGWQKTAPIATRVNIDEGDVAAAIALGIEPVRTPEEWAHIGLKIQKVGTGGTPISEMPAALIDLVTPDSATEYRLGYRNFYVITRYNRSSFYAAAVMDLAAALVASQ